MLPGNVQLPGFSAGLTEKKTENGAALRDPSSLAKIDPDGVRKIRVQIEGIHPGLIFAQPSEIKPPGISDWIYSATTIVGMECSCWQDCLSMISFPPSE
jgi:hypothetical protein